MKLQKNNLDPYRVERYEHALIFAVEENNYTIELTENKDLSNINTIFDLKIEYFRDDFVVISGKQHLYSFITEKTYVSNLEYRPVEPQIKIKKLKKYILFGPVKIGRAHV